MATPKKKQTGGYGINPSMLDLLKAFGNGDLTFEKVAELGSQIGGDGFNQAMAADDPSIYVNSIVGNTSTQQAYANNPLNTGTAGLSLFGSTYDPTQSQAYQNVIGASTSANTNRTNKKYGKLEDFFGIFEALGDFQKGGKIKMQKGGEYTVTDSNASTRDQRMPNYGRNALAMAASSFLPSSELGTDVGYYFKDFEEKEPNVFTPIPRDKFTFVDLLKSAPELIGKRLKDAKALNKGEIYDDEVLIEDAYAAYLGADQPRNSLKPYKGVLPIDLKGEKRVYTLPKKYEIGLLNEVQGAYKQLSESKAPMKRKGDFRLVSLEEVTGYANDETAQAAADAVGAFGQMAFWYNPKTKELRYYDQYDLDKIPLADRLVGEPFKVYGRIKESEDNLESGGKAKLGYADNSPYLNEPSITIPGGNITMANTGRPIMAYPDIGTPKLMPPYSGTHIFPNANNVTEVPMREGGKKKKKIPYYQEGGQGEIPRAVQLEDGELIATPQLDILDTSAKEGHDKMDKDVVTDVLRPEDYVFSFKNKITKKEAENISFGLGAMLYEEGKVPDMPEEQTAAILFKENEKDMPIAEFADRIRKRFPITDKDDVFSKKTNDANRAARLPLLAAAVHINEVKRTKGKGKIESFAPTFVNKYEDTVSAMAGVDNSPARSITALPLDVPEGQDGGPLALVQPILGLTNFIAGLADSAFIQPKRNKLVQEALEQDRNAINNIAGTQSRFAGMSNLAGIAGVIGQDPTVNAPQYDSTQLDQRIRRVPRTLFDFAAGRISSQSLPVQRAIFANSGSFAQGANAYAPIHSANVGAIANLGLNEAQQNIGLENTFRDQKQNFGDRQTLTDTTARNATRTNVNRLTSGLAGQVSSGINAQGAIQSNRMNALRQNDLQQTQAQLDGSQAITQGVINAGNQLGYAAAMTPELNFNQQPFVNNNLPPIQPPSIQRPEVQNPLGLTPIQPLAPYQSYNLPYNQQGSSVPLGPNYVYDPSSGLYFPR